MAQLRQDYQKFVEREALIVAVGPENRADFAEYWHKEKLPFVGLPDPHHEVANLYGQQTKLLKMGRLPAQLVIDKAGQIRDRHYGSSMTDIPPNRDILTLLDKINQEKPDDN